MTETSVITRDDVMEALKEVYDPEIPLSIVDLGLVYDCQVQDGDVKVKMTLTFPGCPMGAYIAQQAKDRIEKIENVANVQVELVYDPPWTPERISEAGKAQLNLD